MRTISEKEVVAMAPNASAVSNARRISQKGGFISLQVSEDDTFYMGECSGSGKSNYITSVDYIDPENPVFRCSCPSRQFPCKHSLALLFEIIAGKSFTICEIPDNIIEKRKKKEIQLEKKEAKKVTPKKTNKAAQAKKIKKQLEGLELAKQLINELLFAGLGTLSGNSLKGYRDLSKQLGDYYLPGPQVELNRFIQEMEALQKEESDSHYTEAINILIRLHTLIKKAEKYLKDSLEKQQSSAEDTILYEGLGGIWQLEQLQDLGLIKENARLVQLSFQVYLDQARGEYIDLGYWVDMDSGDILSTYNYRPIKALKYVKKMDSILEMALIPTLTYYPGGSNRRVRWEGNTYAPITIKEISKIRSHAYQELKIVVKEVKNEIKNVLSDSYVVILISYKMIGCRAGDYYLEDISGTGILLKDMEKKEQTLNRISMLPDTSVLQDQVLMGAVYYDTKLKKMCMQPYTIITKDQIIRLLY